MDEKMHYKIQASYLRELLCECEEELDKRNGNDGSKYEYCVICKSYKYNGSQGIVHDDNCLIKRIRIRIK